MRLEGGVRQELRQGQRLGQTVQQALRLIALAPDRLTDLLAEEATANPFLTLRPPGSAGRPAGPAPEPEAGGPGLHALVLAQLPKLVRSVEDRRVALALTEALDAAGYLDEAPERIARRCGTSVARVEAVLSALRRIEPAGLFARDLADCLTLQLQAEGPLPADLRRLLAHLPLVAAGPGRDLARLCGVTPERLKALLARLRRLDPRPGAAFARPVAPLRIPELLFERTASGWEVRLNPDAVPEVALDDGLLRKTAGRISPDLARARARALHLVTAVEMRNRSLLAVGRCVAVRQVRALGGDPAAQVPLTRRAVAQEVGLHETTVGRIVRHASARVKGRTVDLRQFFGRPAASAIGGEEVSRQCLARRIDDAVGVLGGKGRRVSDLAITAWLAQQGIRVARRTVAKHRRLLAERGGP